MLEEYGLVTFYCLSLYDPVRHGMTQVTSVETDLNRPISEHEVMGRAGVAFRR